MAPSAEEYSGPIEDVPVKETACPECGGKLIGDDVEVGANTEIPKTPKPEIKAYRNFLISISARPGSPPSPMRQTRRSEL
ncbi:MAG: hypothetical protein ACREAB_02345 [Blastocatellia bacterium]